MTETSMELLHRSQHWTTRNRTRSRYVERDQRLRYHTSLSRHTCHRSIHTHRVFLLFLLMLLRCSYRPYVQVTDTRHHLHDFAVTHDHRTRLLEYDRRTRIDDTDDRQQIHRQLRRVQHTVEVQRTAIA